MKLLVSALVLSWAGCAASGTFSQLVESDLPASDGLSCRAYLVWNREPVTDVFLWMGGTGTGTSAFVPDVARELVRSRSAAFITFDKPGVSAAFGDPASVRIDDAPFARHTQGTLLECAAGALELARATLGADLRWHLRGHSEGALIALDLLDRLLADQPAAAERVRTLILSGLPLEPMAEIVRRQLADLPELARAVEDCDWPTMRDRMGVSCAYLADARARPSGREMFARLARRSPGVAIRVFQGDADAHTPARFVRELQAWNAATGHLDLQVRYYGGAHAGSPAARQEMIELLLGLVR
jgi:pimeloyl-ACP methyl ester carboxylesterase